MFTLKKVNITQFRAQMSRYLKLIRGGKGIVLKDRNEEIAQIIPILKSSGKKLTIISAILGVKEFTSFQPPVQTKSTSLKKISSLELLQKLREDRF